MRSKFGLVRTRRAALIACAALVSQSGAMCGAPPPTAAPPTGQTVSFAQQIQPIFTAQCAGCHSTRGLADLQGIALKLVAGQSFAGLVNQASSQSAGLTLVVPGDSADSLLFQKVSSSSPPVGSRMPLIGSVLSATNQGLIRDWIDQGAMNN